MLILLLVQPQEVRMGKVENLPLLDTLYKQLTLKCGRRDMESPARLLTNIKKVAHLLETFSGMN